MFGVAVIVGAADPQAERVNAKIRTKRIEGVVNFIVLPLHLR
jgi:hypothetical protein